MSCLSQDQLNRISHLIKEIEKLSDIEKLFLYLQLPCGRVETVEGKSKTNGRSQSDLFSKKPDQETTQTYTWIWSHLEEDPNVSLPKQEVYDEYRAFCQTNHFEPLCVADFGKAMKHVFPCIKPRRLGQRGNSRYCYSGLRKKYKLQAPNLPDMIEPTFCMDNDCSQTYNQIMKDFHENPDNCSLNKMQDFTGYQAMNLKIEPQNNQHNNYYSTNNNNSNGSNYNIETINKQNDLALKRTFPIHSQTTNDNYHNSNQNHSLNGNQMTRYNHTAYGPIHQRSGTPDDDDYRHNYLDMRQPFARNLYGPIVQSTFSNNNFTNHQPVNNNNNFIYNNNNNNNSNDNCNNNTNDNCNRNNNNDNSGNHSTNTSGTTNRTNQQICRMDTSCNMQQLANGDHHANSANNNNRNSLSLSLNQQAFAGNLNSPENNTNHNHGSHLNQLSNISNSHVDYASPFQSPASTPYPIMSNYPTQTIQDYYSTE